MDSLVPYLTNVWEWATGSAFTFSMILSILAVVAFISVWAMFAVWLERKASADFQVRLGPDRVGPFGLLQSLADGLKLAFKEDLIPRDSDKFLFAIAPAIAFCGAFAAFAALPFAPGITAVDINLGVFFIVAVTAIGVIGVLMAGWCSNNKWSLYGAMREAAQLISYEIPSALALMVPVLVAGTFNLKELVAFQCLPSDGVLDTEGAVYFSNHGWLAFYSPWTFVAFVIYYIASLAECKRAPFDLPEAESELVSGFHTEYSGMRFSFFFLEEYGMMFVVSAIAALAFLGGWQPLPWVSCNFGGVLGNLFFAGVFLAKVIFLVWVQIWVRWTLPRMRVDQVMVMGYKYLIPMSLFALLMMAAYIHWGVRYLPGLF
ncbi:MAG: NADH-quinone oxidoreductase subunit NuoH [Planctomycetes bacterium]|nr:NADH-quinone oxidoreductase subunit NuoH [Planctomycetota bacterium]